MSTAPQPVITQEPDALAGATKATGLRAPDPSTWDNLKGWFHDFHTMPSLEFDQKYAGASERVANIVRNVIPFYKEIERGQKLLESTPAGKKISTEISQQLRDLPQGMAQPGAFGAGGIALGAMESGGRGELSTAISSLAKKLGLEFRGWQEGIPGKVRDQAIFQDTKSGTSIGVWHDELTPKKLEEHTIAARARMQGSEGAPSRKGAPDFSNIPGHKMIEKVPELGQYPKIEQMIKDQKFENLLAKAKGQEIVNKAHEPLLKPDEFSAATGPGKKELKVMKSEAKEAAPEIAKAGIREGFYSHLENVVESLPQQKMTGEQLLNTLVNQGVSKRELEWAGINDLAQQGSLTKDEVLAQARKRAPHVETIEKSAKTIDPYFNEITKQHATMRESLKASLRDELGFSDQQANSILQSHLNESTPEEQLDPDLLKAKDPQKAANWIKNNSAKLKKLTELDEEIDAKQAGFNIGNKGPKYESYTLPGGTNYREVLLQLPTKPIGTEGREAGLYSKRDNYEGSHFDEPNVVAQGQQLIGSHALDFSSIKGHVEHQTEFGASTGPDKQSLERLKKGAAEAAPDIAKAGVSVIENGGWLNENGGWLNEDGKFYPTLKLENHDSAKRRLGNILGPEAIQVGIMNDGGIVLTVPKNNPTARARIIKALQDNPKFKNVEIELGRDNFQEFASPDETIEWLENGGRPGPKEHQVKQIESFEPGDVGYMRPDGTIAHQNDITTAYSDPHYELARKQGEDLAKILDNGGVRYRIDHKGRNKAPVAAVQIVGFSDKAVANAKTVIEKLPTDTVIFESYIGKKGDAYISFDGTPKEVIAQLNRHVRANKGQRYDLETVAKEKLSGKVSLSQLKAGGVEEIAKAKKAGWIRPDGTVDMGKMPFKETDKYLFDSKSHDDATNLWSISRGKKQIQFYALKEALRKDVYQEGFNRFFDPKQEKKNLESNPNESFGNKAFSENFDQYLSEKKPKEFSAGNFFIDREGKSIGGLDLTHNELSHPDTPLKFMKKSGAARIAQFNDELNVQSTKPLSNEQIGAIADVAKKHDLSIYYEGPTNKKEFDEVHKKPPYRTIGDFIRDAKSFQTRTKAQQKLSGKTSLKKEK